MSRPRVLLIVRLILGALLIRQGVIGLSDLPKLTQAMATYSAWQAWPLVGGLRPIEVALWIAASQFAVGIFLFGGLLTRFMALLAALISLFALATINAGLAPHLAHGALLAASLLILLRGGGAGTMDRMLGGMQRRSMEREAEREAAGRAALQPAGDPEH